MQLLSDALWLLFWLGLGCLLLGAITRVVEWWCRTPISPQDAVDRLGSLVDDDTRSRLLAKMKEAR